MQSLLDQIGGFAHDVAQRHAADQLGHLARRTRQVAAGARVVAQAPSDIPDGEAQAGQVATRDRHRGNLHRGGGAMLAAQGGREQPHRPALAQVGHQHVHVDAGAAEPLLEGLVAHHFFTGQLDEVEECMVDAEHAATGVGDHEGIRCALHDAQQHLLAAGQGLLGTCRLWPHADHEVGAALLPEQGHRDRHLRATGQARMQVFDAAAAADLLEQGRQRRRIPGFEVVGQGPARAHQPVAEQGMGCGVGLFQLAGRRFDDQHRFGGQLEQQPGTVFPHGAGASSPAPWTAAR